MAGNGRAGFFETRGAIEQDIFRLFKGLRRGARRQFRPVRSMPLWRARCRVGTSAVSAEGMDAIRAFSFVADHLYRHFDRIVFLTLSKDGAERRR